MNPNLKGCFAENLSVCYLQVRLFDIKTRNYRKDGSKISRSIRSPLVELLYVDVDKKECHIPQKRVK